MENVKKYIEDIYHKNDLNNSYRDYFNNPRLDDCFEGGYDKGYAKAIYDIGKMLEMDLTVPKNYE